jgi:hypothetical protein
MGATGLVPVDVLPGRCRMGFPHLYLPCAPGSDVAASVPDRLSTNGPPLIACRGIVA